MAVSGSGSDNLTDSYLSSIGKLPEQSSTTVRFFERSGSDSDSYLVFGKDAQLAAKDIYQTNAVIKTYGSGSKKLESVNINRTNFESWVRDLLLVKLYRVEVYVNDSNSKGRMNWVPQYKGSPGNLTQFEDLLFSNSEITVNNGVLGVRLGYSDRIKTVGMAHINMNEWHMHLIEFLDDDALTTFESVLVQLAPKEAVLQVSSNNEDINSLKRILERNGVLVNERKLSDFETKDLHQDLEKLLKLKKGEPQNVASHPDLEKQMACSALCGVIKYLELLSGDIYLNQFSLQSFDYGLYAKMDAAACRALHLTQNVLEQNSRNETTLLSVLDKCRTAQGRRLLAQFLKQPLVDLNKLKERLDIVEILVDDVILRQSLYEEHLRKIPDCQMLARKLLKMRATLQDCYKAYSCAKKLPKLLEDLERHDGPNRHIIQAIFVDSINSLQEDFHKFAEMIETTLDLDCAEKGEFVVQSSISDDLQAMRSVMDTIMEKMVKETYEVGNDLNLTASKSLKLESNTQIGYYFRITLKEEKSIRNNKKYTIIHSTKGGVCFQNSRLERLSDEYLKKRLEYENEQKGYVQDILEIARGYAPCFEQLGNLISHLDVLTNFAVVSANSPTPFIRPVLHPKGTGIIKFEGLRHPCVETQPEVNYIPNDIHFSKDEQMFFIVTGPNMGGKSTFLRSVGVATLLAQVGCFVPASYAEISIVDGILARVGAGDNLTKGVSTFMAEMIETSFILRTATPDTLVLIDELGRGTSTYDGFGLCWAISEQLAKTGCYCILATHFHELTSLSEQAKCVVNVHFSAIADESGLTMLYKLEKGPCDRSFGIHVTQVCNFPPDVIEVAKNMAKRLEDFAQDEDKDDDEAAVQRRHINKKNGHKILEDFKDSLKKSFESCQAAITRGEMTKEEANVKFKDVAEKRFSDINEKAKENSYLQHLLQQSEMGAL